MKNLKRIREIISGAVAETQRAIFSPWAMRFKTRFRSRKGWSDTGNGSTEAALYFVRILPRTAIALHSVDLPIGLLNRDESKNFHCLRSPLKIDGKNKKWL
jgi:hypothetical protein